MTIQENGDGEQDQWNRRTAGAGGRRRTRLTPRSTTDGSKADTTASPSNVDVSDTARTLAALEEQIADVPVVSEARVEAVRRALDEGRYHVDAQRVADKMLRFEGDLLAAIPAHK
jgi:negative regulator of flagellin synthesis FlgM